MSDVRRLDLSRLEAALFDEVKLCRCCAKAFRAIEGREFCSDTCRQCFGAYNTQDKMLSEMQANPNDRRHGTITGYTYGCKCDRCRKANWYRGKRRRERK